MEIIRTRTIFVIFHQNLFMQNLLTAKTSVKLNATPERVWKALTDPEEIKQYLFGTKATSDWKIGRLITHTRE